MSHYFPATSDQTPWPAALLSLIPLFIAGSGRLVVLYASNVGRWNETWFYIPYLALCVAAALAGLALGAWKRFPRWSYPYAFTLTFAIADLYSTVSFRGGWPPIFQRMFLLLLAAVLGALYLPPLRAFYRNMRADWTLLSYSLYGLTLFLLSGVDTDESPRLTFLVLLPSLIAVLTALAHLRIRQAPVRILVLVAGTFIGLFFWLIPIFTGMIHILFGIAIGGFMLLGFGLALTAIMLSPLLVNLIRNR